MRESASAVVVNDKGEVLLQLRSDVPIWVLPGGKKEPGETAEQAAVREVLEETGLNVRILRHVGSYRSSYLSYKDRTDVFLCKISGGKLRKNPESAELRFFSQNKLPKPVLQIHRERMEDALSGRENLDKVQEIKLLNMLKDLGFNPLLALRFALFTIAESTRPLHKIFK